MFVYNCIYVHMYIIVTSLQLYIRFNYQLVIIHNSLTNRKITHFSFKISLKRLTDARNYE